MTTLNNADKLKDSLQWREQNLILTKWCLEKYRETKAEEYYKWAKVFGETSKMIKDKYL